MPKRKASRLAEAAATGLAVALAATPVSAAPPQVKVAAVVTFPERSVTFKGSFAEARLAGAGQPLLHFAVRSDAIGATFEAEVRLPGRDTLAGAYGLGDGPGANRAGLDIPRRSPHPGEQRFRLTEGTFRINSYNRAAGTISGTFDGHGATASGAATVDIGHGSFFDVPVK
jgi:hypothetical protein